ncbi:MAG: alcohol dehydrogenase catalytic domain-containing protein [Methanomassiliicoccales archaeon]|nr:alcohol dehydrogenase catalytic domain-containing protein [Methanomassiliicoccales archaeon]TFG56986.1 MAG: alcohol dehydrogenase [Methanomassiliicoccus sp.]
MKAAIMCSPGDLKIIDTEDPVCPSGGALLKVLACAVCGTDVKMLEHGHRDLRYPRIPGHEVTAEIMEMGDSNSLLREGDRVQVWPGESCGHCRHCLSGNDHLCLGIGIMGFNQDGGMAEELAVKDVSRLVPIGRADPIHLTLAEPLACCINAQEKLEVGEGDTVLIMGAGPLGCINAQLARLMGAKKVLVTELEPQRLKVAPKGLYDRLAVPDTTVISQMVMEETSGEGVDVIIPCTPSVRLDHDTFALLAPGGRICVFSGPRKENSPLPVNLSEVHYREQTLVGSYGNSSRHNRMAVEILRQGELDLNWLLTGRFSLERAKEAFAYASASKGMKAVLTI